jgi:hypothetical protein
MAVIVRSEADLKEAIDAKASQVTAAAKTWHSVGQFATGGAVANFLNAPPPQGAGEAMALGYVGGPFEVFIFL